MDSPPSAARGGWGATRPRHPGRACADSGAAAPVHGPVVRSSRVFGTTLTLALTDPEPVGFAEATLARELEAIDRACSRFRADSEIWRLYGSGGEPVPVSPLLFELVAVACDVAERTGGAVDPTVGAAVEALGYDRDFEQVRRRTTPLSEPSGPAPGWWRVELDPPGRRVRVPPGVRLDLGASAKAFAADRGARVIARETGCGVLVSIGGDVSVAGPTPPGGWPVGIAPDSSTPLDAVGHVVSITGGGLASSSTVVRAWRRGDRHLHHIVDPATGDVAGTYWRLVSVAAASCVDANAASTAAIVWGAGAPERLREQGLPARFVRYDGEVVTVEGWPCDMT